MRRDRFGGTCAALLVAMNAHAVIGQLRPAATAADTMARIGPMVPSGEQGSAVLPGPSRCTACRRRPLPARLICAFLAC